MGYELHITRADEWFKAEGNPISLEEWKYYIARDPEMRLEDFAEAKTPSEDVLRYASAGLAVWLAYSGHDQDGNRVWFDLQKGCIEVKNPDEEIIGKMMAIAAALGAKVQGDDGELYGPPKQKRSWWKRVCEL